MNKRLALLFAVLASFIVGTLVIFYNKTIDFPTLFLASKLIVPSAIVAYIGGYYMEKILKTAKVETTVIANEAQKQFVDDLLISPSQVLNEIGFIDEKSETEDTSISQEKDA